MDTKKIVAVWGVTYEKSGIYAVKCYPILAAVYFLYFTLSSDSLKNVSTFSISSFVSIRAKNVLDPFLPRTVASPAGHIYQHAGGLSSHD